MAPNAKVLLIPILKGWQQLPVGQLIGISTDLDEVDAARALAEELKRVDCMFIEGSENAIPWRDEYFDEAYLGCPLTDEIRRVMKPEGTIHECPDGF